MKKIIALVGDSNQGKSTALNIVYDYLTDGGARVIVPKSSLGNVKQNDFSSVIEWNNKTVAFYTMGDYKSNLVDAINNYNSQNVDVLVLAFSFKITWAIQVYLELSKFISVLVPKTVAQSPALESQANKNDVLIIINNI